jgi:hypothetical protein
MKTTNFLNTVSIIDLKVKPLHFRSDLQIFLYFMTTERAAIEVLFSECKPELHKSHEKSFKSMKIKKHSFNIKKP